MPRALLVLLAFLLLSVAAPLPAQKTDHKPHRPNILFAMADDWGWPHAGALGDRVASTPTFDRLAKEGVLFDHAWVSSPSCTPSRNSILTGQQFWRLGEGANLHSTLDVSHPNFMTILREAGYEVGHWRKAWGPGNFRAGGYEVDPCGPASTFEAFLEQRDPAKPFCFWFGTSDPHRGYVAGSGRESGIDPATILLPACWPDREDVRSDVADYYFEVQRWDHDVGEALRMLEAKGVLDDTIVVMTGDHGMPFPRGKGNLYDLGARVPLAVRWGRIAAPGRTDPTLVSLTDLAPTFLAAAGCAVPDTMTGIALLPQLLAPDARRPEAQDFVAFGRERHTPAQELPSLAGYPSRAIRTRDWLLILNLEPDRWPAGVPDGATHTMVRYTDCDDGPTKQVLVQGREDPAIARFWQLCLGRRPGVELYDCRKDPWQVHDLAADPTHRETVAALRARLEGYLAATKDPRFTDAPVRFDDYPYRAGYLKKRLEQQGR